MRLYRCPVLDYRIYAFALAVLGLGIFGFLRNAEWADPEVFYRNEVERQPNHYRSNAALGQVLLSNDKPLEALYYLDRALRINPYKMISIQNLVAALARVGKYDKAMEISMRVYEEMGDRTPADILANMGLILLCHGHFTDSAYFLKKSLQKKENNIYAVQYLGFWHEAQGLTAGAEKFKALHERMKYTGDPIYLTIKDNMILIYD